MYIEIQNNKLIKWSNKEFENSTSVEIDYDYFNQHQDEFKVESGRLVSLEQLEFQALKLGKAKRELAQYNYQQKARVAYGGVNLIINDQTYVFETNDVSITNMTASLLALQNNSDNSELTVNWKVYQNDEPVIIEMNRQNLTSIFTFGMTMINQAFSLEGQCNERLERATFEELQNEEFVEAYKDCVKNLFDSIDNTLSFETPATQV